MNPILIVRDSARVGLAIPKLEAAATPTTPADLRNVRRLVPIEILPRLRSPLCTVIATSRRRRLVGPTLVGNSVLINAIHSPGPRTGWPVSSTRFSTQITCPMRTTRHLAVHGRRGREVLMLLPPECS